MEEPSPAKSIRTFGALRENLIAPHTPSRKQAVIFLIIALLIAAGVAIWEVFLNRATLVLKAPAPFTAIVGSTTVACTVSPCTVELKPKNYTVLFKRSGYFDVEQKITLQRFKENTLEVEFSLIPQLRMSAKQLSSLFPLSSLKTAPEAYSKIPQTGAKIAFNATAEEAIIATQKNLFHYDSATQKVSEVTISVGTPFAWTGNTLIFLAFDDKNTHTLYAYGEEEDSALLYFERPLKESILFTNSSGSHALIGDKIAEGYAYYLINLKTRSRKRIPVPAHTIFESINDAFVIFSEETNPGINEYHAYPFDGDESIILPQAISGTTAMSDANHLLYFTAEKSDAHGDATNISIEDAISQFTLEIGEKGIESIVDGEKKISATSVYLTELSLKTKETKTLLSISLSKNQKITEMENIEGTIFFRIDKQVWELVK